MGVLYHEEEPPPDLTKRCRCLTKALKVKEAFSHCHNLSRQVSCRTHEDDDKEEDDPLDDPNEEQEAIVSEIRSRAITKLRHKSNLSADGFSCVFSPRGIGELNFFTIDGPCKKEAKDDDQGVEKEEFVSMRSFFTFCSTVVASREAFFSAKSNLSRSTSLNDLDTKDLKRRLIFRELCHCEGWPFGLYRKLLFLPSLPKSPTESWSWQKRMRRRPFSQELPALIKEEAPGYFAWFVFMTLVNWRLISHRKVETGNCLIVNINNYLLTASTCLICEIEKRSGISVIHLVIGQHESFHSTIFRK